MTNAIDRPRLAAGRGRFWTASPPGQSRERFRFLILVVEGRDRCLFDNPVVGHTRIIHPRAWTAALGLPAMTNGEWHSPHYSAVESGRERREVAPGRRTNPYGSHSEEKAGRVARRRRRFRPPRTRLSCFTRLSRFLDGRRGGPIGVVKLLRARGGCLGVIRFGRGRLRKAWGSCSTSVDPRIPEQPRELKHLSTWRRRNQPRLPQ